MNRLNSERALHVAVVVRVALEALAGALVADAAVGARSHEVVVAGGGRRELEEVHNAAGAVPVLGVILHIERGLGGASEWDVLVEDDAEAVLKRPGFRRRILLVDLHRLADWTQVFEAGQETLIFSKYLLPRYKNFHIDHFLQSELQHMIQ